MNQSAVAMALALALGACAAQPNAPQPAATPVLPQDPVERAAALLVLAEVHPEARAEHLLALERLGLTLLPDSAEDPVREWRAAAEAGGQVFAPYRGRALGPAYRSGWLEPGARLATEQMFLAGQTARIALNSPSRQPIALTITDPASNLICQRDGTPKGHCQWLSLFTQRYRIEISNPGAVRLRYFLVTN
jgi:hypothetical protein